MYSKTSKSSLTPAIFGILYAGCMVELSDLALLGTFLFSCLRRPVIPQNKLPQWFICSIMLPKFPMGFGHALGHTKQNLKGLKSW